MPVTRNGNGAHKGKAIAWADMTPLQRTVAFGAILGALLVFLSVCVALSVVVLRWAEVITW